MSFGLMVGGDVGAWRIVGGGERVGCVSVGDGRGGECLRANVSERVYRLIFGVPVKIENQSLALHEKKLCTNLQFLEMSGSLFLLCVCAFLDIVEPDC
jgi:hypothetical protein